MTEDYAALRSVKHLLDNSQIRQPTSPTLLEATSMTDSVLAEAVLDQKPVTIFGSKFPADLEYKQICYNINTIKIAMEVGRTVLLLNLDELYESLYDALNQYYSYLGGERFVDLGLGTHRVKCKVHKNFNLIVMARKEVVYERFPIPLINRLEKHIFSTNTLLTGEQKQIAADVEKWCDHFIQAVNSGGILPGMPRKSIQQNRFRRVHSSAFIGYTTDTVPMLLLQAAESLPCKIASDTIRAWCEDRLLQCV